MSERKAPTEAPAELAQCEPGQPTFDPTAAFAPERMGMRNLVRTAAEGMTGEPKNLNGHYPLGLFELEGEDPDDALAALAVPDDRPQVFIEFTEPERQTFFARLYRSENASLQDYTPWRIRAAWRIVREMARISGMVQADEPLNEMELTGRDAWLQGGTCPIPDAKDKHVQRVWKVVECFTGPAGLPLLPPAVPDEWRDANGVRSAYDPRNVGHDPRLHQYLAVIQFVSRYLRIQDGSPLDPFQGRKGMMGLTDPYLCRLAFPSKLQITTWEEHLVRETLQRTIDSTPQDAQKDLINKHGLREHEARSVMRMALSEAGQRMSGSSADDERAIMVMRLEALIHRCKEGGNVRVELNTLKQLAIILGLNKVDPEDIVKEFVEMARMKTQNRRAISENTKTVPALVTTSQTGEDLDL